MYKNRRQFARRRAAAFPHLESRHAEGIPLLVMLSVIRPKMENRIEKKNKSGIALGCDESFYMQAAF